MRFVKSKWFVLGVIAKICVAFAVYLMFMDIPANTSPVEKDIPRASILGQ